MMQLSPNFEISEFGDVPPGLIPIFRQLCERILEPIRAFVGKPIFITSGYRSLLQNKAAHGVPDSEHVATSEYCAADFYFDTTFGSLVSLRACFDWFVRASCLGTSAYSNTARTAVRSFTFRTTQRPYPAGPR